MPTQEEIRERLKEQGKFMVRLAQTHAENPDAGSRKTAKKGNAGNNRR